MKYTGTEVKIELMRANLPACESLLTLIVVSLVLSV
uniref:Uncharacterized protein n=1 Tax=Arundo donax TaxID=35708 RepID=A0A0A9ANE1_ARUDO